MDPWGGFSWSILGETGKSEIQSRAGRASASIITGPLEGGGLAINGEPQSHAISISLSDSTGLAPDNVLCRRETSLRLLLVMICEELLSVRREPNRFLVGSTDSETGLRRTRQVCNQQGTLYLDRTAEPTIGL